MSYLSNAGNRDDVRESLRRMVRDLKTLRGKLDTSGKRCSSCKHMHASNWFEKKTDDALKGAHGRLERIMRDLVEEFGG